MSSSETYDPTLEGIAIVGMAARFPGANSVEAFWQNLRNGVESVAFFSDAEAIAAGVDPALLQDPNYVKAGAVLADIDLFDAAFFGYSPREAEILDPQQRLFLELAWTALEQAGYNPETYLGRIGVHAGISTSSYLTQLKANPSLANAIGDYQLSLSNDKDFLSTRISYKLNLKGPSVSVQTACSTSLVAVCIACQSLLTYQCDMALAGGVSVRVPQTAGYLYQTGGILSPDGHCHAFDANAQGTIGGNGLGAVVLKRLEDAIADRDTIYAVIKGSAINNDGSLKVSYTAPSVEGQAEVIAEAQAIADIDPSSITYIEAHGTGTPLGDPIEIAALTQAFRLGTSQKQFCAIGSVKTNIGHLDTAAGIAGLIKTVLALHHQQIPPSLNFQQPNPKIDFANSPFYVNTQLKDWHPQNTPRRAGVSSFGIGGTNAHVILEEAPIPDLSHTSPSRPWQLLILSTKTPTALDSATQNLATHLQQNPHLPLPDIAHTLQVGRKPFNHRRFLLCQTADDALQALAQPQTLPTQATETRDRPIVFLFSGQGSQYPNMGRDLYQSEPLFRQHIDHCAQLLQPHLGLDLRTLLYPNSSNTTYPHPTEDPNHPDSSLTADNPFGGGLGEAGRPPEKGVWGSPPTARTLNQTHFTQPAIFVIEYALAKLWQSWGIQPQTLIGHSIGEYTAACLAGVFSLEDALKLVTLRGQLMQQLPTGAMLAVSLSADAIAPLLTPALSLSAINAPNLSVISGPTDAIAALEAQLTEQNILCRRLHTSHAFHSAMMEPILPAFAEHLKSITLHPPQIPFISNLTGTWITAEQATSPDYWVQHLRQPVQFAAGIAALMQQRDRIFLEVGPGRTLTTLAKQQPNAQAFALLTSLRHPQETQSDSAFILNTLGQLWLAGAAIDWSGFYAQEQRRRVPLPTYPFERQRYWIDAQTQTPTAIASPSTKKQEMANWFSMPVWKQTRSPKPLSESNCTPKQWLIFADECGLGEGMAQQLQKMGYKVALVRPGEQFQHVGEATYTLSPQRSQDYEALWQDLTQRGYQPQAIAHLWQVTFESSGASELENWEATQQSGFYSLLYLAQAFGQQSEQPATRLHVITNQLHNVTGSDSVCPAKATILGPCRVIPQEYPIATRSIDVVVPPANSWRFQALVDQLIAEFDAPEIKPANPLIAYRGVHRWEQTFESVPLDASTPASLREQGVYLITGGFGGIGLALAEHLARTVQAKLILVSRSGLPERSQWQMRLDTHDPQDATSQKIQAVQKLEAQGAEVLVCQADVADLAQMQQAIAQAQTVFGTIHGVIHAAGIPGGGLIQLKTPAIANSVLAPKVKGTLVLETLLQDQPLDFLVLCSSLTSILGGVGQVDYCAANAFLDAIAQHNTSPHHPHTLAINWDTWQSVGMAVNASIPEALKAQREAQLELGITPTEGIKAFQLVLHSGLSQVVVTPQPWSQLIEQTQSLQVEFSKATPEPNTQASHARPNLGTAYEAPRNETERRVATLWQTLLGIEAIGVHDNFFELGGHSLLATQVISGIRQAFQVELPIRSLFETPTIAGLAQHIQQAKQTQDEVSEAPAIIPVARDRYRIKLSSLPSPTNGSRNS